MSNSEATVARSNSSNSAWRIVRHMQLSHADIYEGTEEPSVPIFHPEWEQEYLETSFQPLEIRIFSFISSVYYLLHFLIVEFSNTDDGAGGNRFWVLMTWLPELYAAVSSAIVFFLVTLPKTHKFCRRIYDLICAYTILISYLAALIPSVVLEVRRARFQREGVTQISWGIDFSVFPPARTCNDSDPLQSSSLPIAYATSLGCNNLVISGNIYSIYILHVLLPRIFRNGSPTAVAVALSASAALVAALVAVGTLPRDPGASTAVAFQLLVGLGAAYFCHVRKQISRQQFAVAKGTKFATEQNRNLLNTLIPQNVVQKLAGHKGGSMLGNEVKECTVMFCSLEPQARARERERERERGTEGEREGGREGEREREGGPASMEGGRARGRARGRATHIATQSCSVLLCAGRWSCRPPRRGRSLRCWTRSRAIPREREREGGRER